MPTPEEIEAQKAAEAPVAAAAPGGDRKVISLPAASLGRIRREERDAGRRQYAAELDEAAKAAGFESHADMAAYLGSLKKQAAAKPQQDRPARDDRRDRRDTRPNNGGQRDDRPAPEPQMSKTDRKLQRRLEELERQQARQREDARQARRQAEEAQRERDRAEARMQLALMAAEAGIVGERNVKFALLALDEELQSMDDKARAELDERKFFAGMVEQMPHLGGGKVEKKPLNTGTPGGGAPAATQGKPGGAAPTAGKGEERSLGLGAPQTQKEREAYRKEFEEALARHGLNPDFGHGIEVHRGN
jgi:hypothetical protein